MLTYDEKHQIFLRIKNNGPALARAKQARKDFTTWKTNEVSTAPGKDAGMIGLSNIVDYFTRDYTGALQALAGDRFTIEYQLYNDVERVQVMGEATVGVRVPITWEKSDVTAVVYPAQLQSVGAAEWATKLYTASANRSDISKGTGWNRNDCNDAPIRVIESLRDCVKVATSGQHKLTRLVKGFLIYLDLLNHGYVDYTKLLLREEQVELGPRSVAGEFNQGGSAFVYSSSPRSEPHNAMCYMMASEFPPRVMRDRHVIIPADSGLVKLVTSMPVIDRLDISCRLTADLALSSICKYAGDFNLRGDIQQAYTIACALSQNKYLTQVSLPAVVSTIDLVPTALVQIEKSAMAPHATAEFSNVVGKLYQMSAMVTAKDMICAVNNTTKEGLSGYQTLEMYLTHHNATIERTGAYATAIPMLELCPEMKWLDQLDSGDMEYLSNSVGAFEGIWLCRGAKAGVEHGLLQTMLQGKSDLTGDNVHRDTLISELRNSEVEIELADVPKSMFMMEGTCIHANYKRGPRRRKWVKHFGEKMSTEGLLKSREKKPAVRRTNVRGSMGYTSNRSSVVSPIREMKSKRETMAEKMEQIYAEGDEETRVPKPIEQVIAEEATGRKTEYARVRPNIMRDEEKERALESASQVMDGEDFEYFHSLVDTQKLENIPVIWNKRDTSEDTQRFLLGINVASNSPELEWKLEVQEWALEHDMCMALAKCDSKRGFANMIKSRGKIYDADEDSVIGDEITRIREQIEKQEALKDEEAANLRKISRIMRTHQQTQEEKKTSYSEGDLDARAREERANFEGDVSKLSLSTMRYVKESAVFRRYLMNIEAGSVVFSKPATDGLLDWAEATQCDKQTMEAVAPHIARTKTRLGEKPLRGKTFWMKLVNIETPRKRSTSLGKMNFSANDAKVAAFYASVGWRGYSKAVFEAINKEYLLDMESVNAMFEETSSFSSKSGST